MNSWNRAPRMKPHCRLWLSLVGLIGLLPSPPVAAHTHDPLVFTVPQGQSRQWHIYADIIEEPGGTFYELAEPKPNPAIIKVEPIKSFSQAILGSWTIEGLAVGSTTAMFHWRYKHANGQIVEQTLSVTVNVAPPPGSAASNPNCVSIVDPVNSRNGEFFAEESVDLNLGGPMPLVFSRYYSSLLQTEGFASSALGANRLHSFDWKFNIEIPDQRLRITTDRGRPIYFEKVGLKPAWVLSGRTDIPFQLVQTGNDYRLADPMTEVVRTFNSVSGKLTAVTDGRGNTHTLTYVGNDLDTVSDGLGRSLSFQHTSGKLTRVTDQTGRQVNFFYSGNDLFTAANPLNEVTQYNYTSNLLTSILQPENNVPFTQIFTAGKVTSQTERGTDTTSMVFNAATTEITNPAGDTMTHAYASRGELTSITDEGGKVITMTSDSSGRRNSVTDRLGATTTMAYHTLSGKPALITNAESKTTAMTYKSRLLNGHTFYDLTKIAQTDGSSQSFTYDSQGKITQMTDEAGKVWKYVYNPRGQLTSRTNPLGGIYTYVYDGAGNLTSSKDPDPDSLPTQYTYDSQKRLEKIIRPGGSFVQFAYDAADRVTSVTDERGNPFTFAHDDNGRLTTVTDPDLNTKTYAYDDLNRMTQATDTLGKTSSMTYNSRRLLESMTDRNGNTVSFQYDERQRLTGITDANGKVWGRGYDDEGLLTSTTTPIDPPTKIKRNSLGRPVELSDALGNTELLTRDAMQRIVSSCDPVGRQTKFAYDKRGLLTSVTLQTVGTAKYDRDGLGNITKITEPNGSIWTYTYLKSGRMASMVDPLGKKWLYDYDARGRLEMTKYPDTTTATLTYDDAGNVQTHQHTNGPTLTYTYDNLGRVTSADGLVFSYDPEGRLTNAEQNSLDFKATYDDEGRLLTVSYHDGAVVVSYQYDFNDRLKRVTDSFATAQIDFSYDDAGRLTGITRSNGVNGIFTYDAAGRLTRIQEGTALDLKYALNAAGQITTIDHTSDLPPAVLAAAQTFKFDKASQVGTTGYVYDARGRLVAAPVGKVYGWDGASRLTNADGVTLAYNGMGDVTERTAGLAVTRFYNHYAIGLNPIVYEDPPSGSDRAYVWTPDGELLYSIDMGSALPSFYHFDHLGSTLALTNSAGLVTDSYAYDPYGQLLDHSGPSTQPFTYVGEYGVRTEGALYQMRARYYDPITVRFLSRDPMPADLTSPEGLNPYQYAEEDPLSYIDPAGTQGERSGDRCRPCRRQRKAERRARRLAEEAARLEEWYRHEYPMPRVDGASIGKPPSFCHSGGTALLCDSVSGLAITPCTEGEPTRDLPSTDPPFDEGLNEGSNPFGSSTIPISDESNAPPANNNNGPAVATPATDPMDAYIKNMLIGMFTAIYMNLQNAWYEQSQKFADSGFKDKAIRDRMSAIDKARKAIGAQIEAFGGTPPPPPQ